MLLTLAPISLLLLTAACAETPAEVEQESTREVTLEFEAENRWPGREGERVPVTATFRPDRAGGQEPGAQQPAGGFQPIRFGDKEGWEWTEEFFPGTPYADGVTHPDAVLGQPLGSRLAHHGEILACFQAWAQESDRITLHEYGRTYEGRPLVYAVITSPANHARLEELRQGNQRLADPRGLSQADGERLTRDLPAVAWMGYSIHGDETSGADASMAVGYHLVAGEGAEVAQLLENLVVVLDPVMNPDGRMRIVPMTEQMSGFRTTLDPASMSRGRWPYGRGNHYLFDMNRDWMTGVAPETRGRWAVNLEWRPQLFVDAHEQGGADTFLMYPQAKPRHPELPAELLKWQGRFADDHGAAFDAYGWGYYTREWADAWFPGYSDAWGSMNGAIGMLYEQARFAGQPYRRPSGEVVPYRRAVHAQALASLSNLKTLAANREAILRDYLANRRSQVDGSREDAGRAWMLEAPEGDPRAAALVDTLLRQGVEVYRADAGFEAADAVHSLGGSRESRAFPAGTLVVPTAQPQGALVRAYLDFDPRMAADLLQEERARLERGEGSNLYDVTAWDLGRAFALDAWWATPGEVGMSRVESAAAAPGGAAKDFQGPATAWAVDAGDDRSVAFAARALELGLRVHLADRPFVGRAGEQATTFARGSLLLRRHENQGVAMDALVARAAAETGVRAVALTTFRAPDLEQPDLGGQHFELLRRPRVALLAGPSVGTSSFGHVWQYLDEVLRVPVTLLDADRLGWADLRDYNVIVAPPGASLGDAERALDDWIRDGGTLVAMDSAAASVAASGMSSVKLRRDALDMLDEHAFAVARHRDAGAPIDFADLWGDPAEAAPDAGSGASGDDAGATDGAEQGDDTAEGAPRHPDAAQQDAWMRRFAPAGSILRVELDPTSFLTVGRGAEIPVYTEGSRVFLSTDAVAGRYAAEDRLRLGGLLWPEARERTADSVYLARERHGRGQVILFAQHPVFRGAWRGTARLLGNAVVYGPGAGADPPPTR